MDSSAAPIGLSELPPPVLHAKSRTPDRIAGAALAVLAMLVGLMIFVVLVISMSGGF